MERTELKKILAGVRAGRIPVDEALALFRGHTFDEVGFATLDLHRAIRRGFPEVVFGQGKSAEQIVEIMDRLSSANQTVLVTRVPPEVHRAVVERFPKAVYHEKARAIVLRRGRARAGRPGIVVMTAGTSDIPVAEEAAVTAEVMGNRVVRVHDVGVAGIHRLTAHKEKILAARAIVVVAGMEGALPSVVAGLTDCPVIGVPTSTGYGEGGRGRAALLSMLNSCASGLTVVNIDNGFGAGYTAALINRKR
jgi:NCAIR mutase (PurE)-related protein